MISSRRSRWLVVVGVLVALAATGLRVGRERRADAEPPRLPAVAQSLPIAPIQEPSAAVIPVSQPTPQPRPAWLRERVAPLREIVTERNAELSLTLFDDVTATVAIQRVQTLGPDRTVTFGAVTGVDGSEFILAREGDVVAATVFIPPTGQYEIRYAGDGRHIVRQIDSEKLPQCAGDHHAPVAGDEAGDQPEEPPAAASTAPAMDILVVYTAQARAAAGGTAGIHTVIDLAVAQANLGFQNSQVNAQLNLVYRGEINYTESGSMSTDLSRVTSTSDGHLDDVHSLRDTYGADLVSLFTSTGESGYAGIAWVMCNVGSSFRSYAFSVVRQQYATSHTFAHEIGHNLGCAHDHDNGGCGAFPHSYGHRFTASNGTQYRTIMAYAPGQRITYFSNPNVTYLGGVTGVAGSGADAADNARTINDTVAVVAAFRTSANPPPFPPGNFTAAAASESQINLAWQDNSTNETGFVLESASAASGPWTTLALLGADVTSHAHTGLAANTTHYYRLFAYNAAGNSATTSVASATTLTAPDTTAPSVPASVVATATSATQITVTWSAATDSGGSGLAGYRLYRDGALVATVSGTSHHVTGLGAATTYCFTVAAYDHAGNQSAASSNACATTFAHPPTAPAGLTASAVAHNRIQLNWQDAASNELGFYVERAATAAGPWSVIATPAANTTAYNDSTVTGSTTYYYRVRAYHTTGQSSYSNVASATTPATPDTTAPMTPTGLTATVASGLRVELRWNASTDSGGSGLAGYRVYRDGALVGQTGLTAYSATGLTPGQSYCFAVSAVDGAGNESAPAAPVCVTTKSYVSPVGTWEVTVGGRQRGVLYATFAEDFTWAGTGMLAGQCGLFAWSGTWQFDETGRAQATFTRQNEEAGCADTNIVSGQVTVWVSSRGRLSGRGGEGTVTFSWRGEPVGEFADWSGAWNATRTEGRAHVAETCDWQPTALGPLYVVGGAAAEGGYALEGMMLVTSRARVLGYLFREASAGQSVSVYAGLARPTRHTWWMNGRNETGAPHRLTAVPVEP